MSDEVHLKKPDDNVAEVSEPRSIEKPETSSPAEAESILIEEIAEEIRQTPSSSGYSTPTDSSDSTIRNSDATSEDFGTNYLEIPEMILMPKVIEISAPPSPNKVEVTSENNDYKDPIDIQDPEKKVAGFHSSASAKGHLDENAGNKSSTEKYHTTSSCKPIFIAPPSSPTDEYMEKPDLIDPIKVLDQVRSELASKASSSENRPNNKDADSDSIKECCVKAEETTKAKEQDQSSQSSAESKDTSFPKQDQTERKSCSSSSSNLPTSSTTESARELNEGVKLEPRAVEKPQPSPPVRPGILKYPTVKETETETTVTKSEFAELLGKLISAIKIEEGVEITVEELTDEIFYYFGGNKEIMEVRLSGDYVEGIISKLTEQEPSEKKPVRKCVTFALETEELEIKPRQRTRSNSLVDKSTEKLKRVRSFIEKIFHI